MWPDAQREIRLRAPLDLRLTLAPVRRGGNDPTVRLDARTCWRATRTPDGPATTHLELTGDRLAVRAWGPGAGWAVEHVPALIGDADDTSDFHPAHPLVRALARRHPGLRIGATGAVCEALVPTVLEQKVTGLEARRSYRRLVLQLGEPAPGPPGLVLPPSAATLARTPHWTFHRAGVERKRADTICRAAARAVRLEETTAMSMPDAYRRLQAFPGIGPWSAAEIAAVALGDPDAVSVGDYHLPDQVAWALAGEARADDARLLELLEPFRGHRARVVRLVLSAGLRPPRYGPRLAPRSIAQL
jgi:3-methyladenine DNA glycosylase/8-oxoguanine DNA glycosylase